jgi:hypothetical protein
MKQQDTPQRDCTAECASYCVCCTAQGSAQSHPAGVQHAAAERHVQCQSQHTTACRVCQKTMASLVSCPPGMYPYHAATVLTPVNTLLHQCAPPASVPVTTSQSNKPRALEELHWMQQHGTGLLRVLSEDPHTGRHAKVALCSAVQRAQ